MAQAGVLERESRVARPRGDGRHRRTASRIARHALVVLAVVAATLVGGYVALSTYGQSRQLSIGQIQLSADPGHRGALDLYVPLVDWGVRFENAIRLPVRLHVDLRTVDRSAVARVAQGGTFNVGEVRAEARDAIAGYLRALIGVVLACAALAGVVFAFAVRHRAGPRLRYTLAAVAATTAAIGVALVVLLPPRGNMDEPQYYAFGPDIPRALQAVESVQQSTRALDQELDAQLVGLARLVTRPSQRTPLIDRPTITVASDLHNNFLALGILDRAASNGPLFFAGDLTDRGSPLESRLVSRVVDVGRPFVFVSGNHDSDSLEQDLAERGAIVLTQHGRLKKDGTYGDKVVNVAGLRVAGYSDPFERRAGENFNDRYQPRPSAAQQDAFTAWMRPLLGKVDVIMVHEPALIEPALAMLEDDPPSRPLVFVMGHTHHADIQHFAGVTVLNGGSIGGGGTGNLSEPTDYGIARLTYTTAPAFQPLAADLVSIDPGSGSSTARRERLDAPAE
jgi:predicted phosphodiesterase